ncbi:hypothetical protein PHMEG_0004749 [Phytophthora megakarya]|uniref:Chromo domain-containing protein n=1 Tax=Phytophthora megakarya TaxID=4795 RepID=A0A225WT42_9STRA|nr:hypothetical protein PHMEG_0004749 [Phytophthora megakarya]
MLRSRYAAVALSVNAKFREAITDRASRHNEDSQRRIRSEIAHLWHGPFRVAEKINEFTLKLEIAGTRYQILPVVHVSKLKLVKEFPDRLRVEITVSESDRLDFDEILLPENSWVPDLGANDGKKIRFGRIYREFLVHWAGYNEATWVDEADLNCGTILNAFLRERANRDAIA